MSARKDRRQEGVPVEPEEVEILEVVGMEEGAAPPAGGDEVEIVFDGTEEVAGPAPSALPPAEDSAVRERLLRLQADFENLKKRVDREREEFTRRAAGRLVGSLLPVLDNLERAIAAARAETGGEALRAGVELIHRQLLEALRREGVRCVESLGKPFDPSVHEAVLTEESSELPPQTILEELRRGYYLNDHLLRPALVKVSVEPGGTAEPESSVEEA